MSKQNRWTVTLLMLVSGIALVIFLAKDTGTTPNQLAAADAAQAAEANQSSPSSSLNTSISAKDTVVLRQSTAQSYLQSSNQGSGDSAFRLTAAELSEGEAHEIRMSLPDFIELEIKSFSNVRKLRKNKDPQGVIQELMDKAKAEDMDALYVLNKTARNCVGRPIKKNKLCTSLYQNFLDFYKKRGLSPIDTIDRLAQSGDLYAQFVYHQTLLDAVENYTMNTARDGALWLERRKRMIEYDMKFAQAGSPRAVLKLAILLDHSEYIEAQPFWAAVMYRQLSESDTFWLEKYENLVDKFLLDSHAVENERDLLFGIPE